MITPFHANRVTLVEFSLSLMGISRLLPKTLPTCQMSCCQVVNFEGLVFQRTKRVWSHDTFCDFINRFITTLLSSFISQRASEMDPNVPDYVKFPFWPLMAQGNLSILFWIVWNTRFHMEYATVVSTRDEPQYSGNKREGKQFSVPMWIRI